jgi:site-specific recombinase XerD
MHLSEAIRDYCDYARHELGHTTTTHLTYQSRLRHFLRWLAQNGVEDPPVGEVTPALIRRYSYSLSGRNLRPRTVRGALNAIRALFSYLVEAHVLTASPAAEVRLPKRDAATRLLVGDDDLARLLEAATRQRSEFRCLRDRAVLSVLIFCGLRRQELLDLTVQAVNLEERSLLIQQGKGQKSRTVFLCDEALEALRDWLVVRRGMRSPHDALFIVSDRRRFGETTLASMMEEVKAIAGLRGDARIKPHSIRHAAATRLLRNGADLRSIQAWLGHTQLQTTAVYLHTDEQQVKKIAPMASLRQPTTDTPAEPRPTPTRRADFFRHRRSA